MGSSFFLVRKIENESFPCMHSLDEWTRPVWQDNSHHVRTNEKNSGDAVLRLGTVIQSIFCAQSDAILKRDWWESVLGGSSTLAWKLLYTFSPDPTDWPRVSKDDVLFYFMYLYWSILFDILEWKIQKHYFHSFFSFPFLIFHKFTLFFQVIAPF